MPNPQIELDIAILGGGFGGIYCGKSLARFARKKDLRVGIVSNQNYMVFQPMLAEVAGASLAPRHVVNPIRALCPNSRVLKAEVKSINLTDKEVIISASEDSHPTTISFKHLVLALGAQIDLSRVPGMPQHALLMQNVGDAMVLRASIINRIEQANLEQNAEERKRLLHFVVVGGGYSGVETAGQIADMTRGIARYYPEIDRSDFRVTLIHSGKHILPTLDEKLGRYAENALRDQGVDFRLGCRVNTVTASRVYLNDDSTIESPTVICTVGNAPHKIIKSLESEYGLETEKGRIKVTNSFNATSCDWLWAVGDCAAVPMGNGICPPTAQFASRQGAVCGKNIARAIAGKPLLPFTFKGLGELAAIGHRKAVAKVGNMKFKGFFAWWLWRSIYLMKLPGIERKLRVVLDWTLDLFFPRDINLLNPQYTRLLQSFYLDTGERLFNKNEPADALYVVRSGSIRILDNNHLVRTMTPGSYFGERAILHGERRLYDAEAAEASEVVAVRKEVALPLIQESAILRRIFQRTTQELKPEDELAAIKRYVKPELLEKNVSEIMNTDLALFKTSYSIREALKIVQSQRHTFYPLVDDNSVFKGSLQRETLLEWIKSRSHTMDDLLERIEPDRQPIIKPDTPIIQALDNMVREGCFLCWIVDDSERLIGGVSMTDLMFKESRTQAAAAN